MAVRERSGRFCRVTACPRAEWQSWNGFVGKVVARNGLAVMDRQGKDRSAGYGKGRAVMDRLGTERMSLYRTASAVMESCASESPVAEGSATERQSRIGKPRSAS